MELIDYVADQSTFFPFSFNLLPTNHPPFEGGEESTEAIAHYQAGGRTITQGEWAGVGSTSPYKSGFIKGFTITPAETADLIAFLQSLTDEDFITNPAYRDPNVPTVK